MEPLKIPEQLDLSELLTLAIEAAKEPAEDILNYFHQSDLKVEKKVDCSPVTVADREAERRIRQRLEKHSSTDSLDILGEEQGLKGTGARFRWTIDPIDGTRSFVRGIPLFGTIVALEDTMAQRALIGVIHLPVLQTTYSAARGMGSWCNLQQIRVSSVTTVNDAIISVGDPRQFVQANCEALYPQLVELCPGLRGYTDCFGHTLVACGAVDAMLDPDLNPWDVLATQVLIEEAGGVVLLRPSRNEGKVDALFGNPDLVKLLSQELQFSH